MICATGRTPLCSFGYLYVGAAALQSPIAHIRADSGENGAGNPQFPVVPRQVTPAAVSAAMIGAIPVR